MHDTKKNGDGLKEIQQNTTRTYLNLLNVISNINIITDCSDLYKILTTVQTFVTVAINLSLKL